MSCSEDKWAGLTSRDERVARPDEPTLRLTDMTAAPARTQWDELASQSERLADASDPLIGLASSSRSMPVMRLVAPGAA
jgi:hypothetical protein